MEHNEYLSIKKTLLTCANRLLEIILYVLAPFKNVRPFKLVQWKFLKVLFD